MYNYINNSINMSILQSVQVLLNYSGKLTTSPEVTKFRSFLETHKGQSGDVFVKQLLIKCLETCVDSSLILASNDEIGKIISKDKVMMCSAKPSEASLAKYKIFVGKMISNIYDYEIDESKYTNTIMNDLDNLQDFSLIHELLMLSAFKEGILKTIPKDTLVKNMFDYMNLLQEDDINSGKKLFTLLVNVFYKMYEKTFTQFMEKVCEDMPVSDDRFVFLLRQIYGGFNAPFEYKPQYYDDNDSSSSDDDDSEYTPEVNDEPKLKNCDMPNDDIKLVNYSYSTDDDDDDSYTETPKVSLKNKRDVTDDIQNIKKRKIY